MRFCINPFTELENARSAYVKQQRDWTEIYTGCDMPNKYHIYTKDSQGNSTYLFKCSEESGWCTRNCVSTGCRSMKLSIAHVQRPDQIQTSQKLPLFATIEREYSCACFCCGR